MTLGAVAAHALGLDPSAAVVLPAMPGFYHNPVTIHDLIDFVVGRICDQLGIRHDLVRRWGAAGTLGLGRGATVRIDRE